MSIISAVVDPLFFLFCLKSLEFLVIYSFKCIEVWLVLVKELMPVAEMGDGCTQSLLWHCCDIL